MLTTERIAGVVVVVLGLFVVWESLWSARRLPLGTLRTPGPAYVPVVLAALLVVFGLAIVALGARAPRIGAVGWTESRHAAGILATCAFAALMLERLGYRLTLAVVLFVLLGVLERKSVLFALVFAGVLAFGSFFLFDRVLRVPLPRSPLGL